MVAKCIGRRVKRIFLCLFFLGLMCISGPVSASIYYIDLDDGDDSNSGLSRTEAWKTIPGTRTVDAGDWIQTQWGPPGDIVVNSSNELPAGTILKLRRGVIHDQTKGGQILINSTYYDIDATIDNPIKFELDEQWDSGSIIFDGTGIELNRFGNGSADGYGLIHIEIGGVEFDGKAPRGIVVRDSKWMGISCYATNTPLVGCSFRYIKFYNNGTGIEEDRIGAASGQLYILNHIGGIVDNCEFDGNKAANGYINGIHLGQSSRRVVGYTVSNCVSYNHKGTNDAGMGFKAQNSQVTFISCTAYGNYKGWDLGEVTANPYWGIIYKTINCSAYNNDFGINMNGPYDPDQADIEWYAPVRFYIINCILRDNYYSGTEIYAGPFDAWVIHSVYDNNGNDTKEANILIGPDGVADHHRINAYLYNNVFYKPKVDSSRANYVCTYWVEGDTEPENNTYFNLDSDYNVWVQNSSEYFCRWGFWGGDETSYSYGPDGPGHGAGSAWYDEYGSTMTAPLNGSSGHHGSDLHSKGTGAESEILPPFRNLPGHNYNLTAHYRGLNLTSKAWYIKEMGIDRNGNKRSSWDIGAYEYIDRVELFYEILSEGDLRISWTPTQGRRYVLRWSDDLTNWNDIPLGKVEDWVDTNTGNYSRKFYQVYEYEFKIYRIEKVGDAVNLYWNREPGINYVVRWSVNLQDWTDIYVGASSDWTDTDITGYSHKFYQVYEQ